MFEILIIRARRRRMRETSLAGISHEEGLSSDDEETPSQRIIDDETISNFLFITKVINMIF